MYCENAHKEYLNLAKSKKPSADKIRSVVKGQLQYLRRDLHYIEGLMAKGQKLDDREMRKFVVIRELYLQQKYMYDNKVPRGSQDWQPSNAVHSSDCQRQDQQTG